MGTIAKYTVYGLPGVYNAIPLSLNDGDGVALAVTQQGQLIVVNADGTAVGAGIEYTDGGVPPAHPKAPSLVWSDGANWQTVSTAKPLPVTATFTPSGTQDINLKQVGGATFALGQQSAAASLPIVLTAAQITTLTPPAAITGFALEAGNLATIAGIVTSARAAVNPISGQAGVQGGSGVVTALTQRIVLATDVALPTGTNVIGHVIVDTGSTTAVTQATASSLNATVIGTGTFAVQATPVTQADTFMLGGVNIKEINAVTPLMGNGTTGTGSLRVTIASDNTPFSVNATLSAETTKVIGVTRAADGAGNLITTNSTTYTAKFAPDTNLLGTLGTAFTNAGKVNVHGAVATNIAITDNPLNLGAQAVSSENAAVTTARQVQLVADLVGKLIVLPYANPENFVNGTTAAITDTTSTSTIAAQASGVRTYITQITVTNSHATVGTFVKILDGATIIHEGYAAAAGGGYTATFPVPLRGSTATAVNTQPVTTGANVIASVSGYKGV